MEITKCKIPEKYETVGKDTQLKRMSKHRNDLGCRKPYSLKIGCTVWRKTKKSILQYGVKKPK